MVGALQSCNRGIDPWYRADGSWLRLSRRSASNLRIVQPPTRRLDEDGVLKLLTRGAVCQLGEVDLDRCYAKLLDLGNLVSGARVGDAELHHQIAICAAHDHVWCDRTHSPFQDCCIEAVVPARVAEPRLTVLWQRRQNEREPGREQFLGEAVKGSLRSALAGVLTPSTLVPEVMRHLFAFARYQEPVTARASATAGNTRGHLGDVSEHTVRTFAEEQALRGMSGRYTVLHGHLTLTARTCISLVALPSPLLNHATPGWGMLNLSPPRAITFLVSLLLIGLAVASLYLRIPTIGPTVAKFRTWFFVGAYAVLALGVVSRSL